MQCASSVKVKGLASTLMRAIALWPRSALYPDVSNTFTHGLAENPARKVMPCHPTGHNNIAEDQSDGFVGLQPFDRLRTRPSLDDCIAQGLQAL